MGSRSLKQKWMGKFRFLSQALIFSGALNISLLATFFYFVLREKEVPIVYEMRPLPAKLVEQKQKSSNHSQLSKFASYSYRELVSLLSCKEYVEEGYTIRDLALASLVQFSYFDIEKALSGQPLQRRQLFYTDPSTGKNTPVVAFAGLTDYQYDAIIHYAYTEKWPLTSKGIFLLLKKWKAPRDLSLEQVFCMTPEFHAVKNLLFRQEDSMDEALVLEMLLQGGWEPLRKLVDEQKEVHDLSMEKKRSFLQEYIDKGSSQAAALLLELDFSYALKRLDDTQVLKILPLLHERSDLAQSFCYELLKSSRSDLVWKKSADRLYYFASEEMPEPYDHQRALQRFDLSVKRQSWGAKDEECVALSSIIWGEEKTPVRLHVVEEGDNLWKIARIYEVEVEELIRINQLEGDCIYPGSAIIIP